jgi:hypothetical protein
MRSHSNDTNAPISHDNESLASSSNQITPAATSMAESSEKTSGRWTDDEVKLLLNYVEAKCTLTTARGLNLKKSQFNEACEWVKTKDAGQCHYKWGHVGVSVIDKGFDCLSSLITAM